MQTEYEAQATYETVGGDRVALFRHDGEWFICWAYGDPHTGTPQLVGFGDAGPEAIDAFVSGREGKSLAYDSRVDWMTGSL